MRSYFQATQKDDPTKFGTADLILSYPLNANPPDVKDSFYSLEVKFQR
jgi:hypothetical protein